MRIRWKLPLDADGVTGELDDGTPFVIRPIRASDGPALAAAFTRMSARSRYLRFFTVRETLGQQLTESLTDIDHGRHRAWVVADPEAPSDVGSEKGRGIAVARLIEIDGEPGVAEAAVVVTDDYQGRGFGSLLLDLLVGTARDTGIDFIRFETLAENRSMRALLDKLGATANVDRSDREVLVFDLPVANAPSDDPGFGALYEILRFIAQSEDAGSAN